MFSIKKINDNDFEKIILVDEDLKTTVAIVPSCGGILQAFNVVNLKNNINVIDSYLNKIDFKDNLTSKGFKSCKLSPFVCRIENATYNFDNNEYTINKFLLGKNALHGLLYNANFLVSATSSNQASAAVCLIYEYNEEENGFPFKYTCEIKYELSKNNTLSISTTITNNSNCTIPMQDGWHPYFSLNSKIDDLLLQINSKEILEFDTNLIPTKKLNKYNKYASPKKIDDSLFDNCFTLNFIENEPICILQNVVQNLQIQIFTNNSYPYLQIYTPPHRNSIAIENLSGAPNGFNNGLGLLVMQPNQSINFNTSYKVTNIY